jgi:phosphoribosylanthranilate isomerase
MIIKVCGLREAGNISRINQLDIDFMGFIFYPASPRYVKEDDFVSIRESHKHRVGVFVNDDFDTIRRKAGLLQLTHIQLHGSEAPELCNKLKNAGYTVLKAFSISGKEDFRSATDYHDNVDYYLFDTKSSGYGGSGKTFDWSLLDEYNEDIPFLLSGGLNPGSIDDLKEFGHPQFAGVDLNSGFEISPALKDVEKLKSFVTAFRTLTR